MTEANFSFTTKINGDLFTVRGNTIQEFMQNVESARTAVASVTSLAQSTQSTPMRQAIQVMEEVFNTGDSKGITTESISDAIEQIVDKYGNEWTYGHPEAPMLPDGRGRYARKKGKSKAGKVYTGWFDPAKGPKPFPKGEVEAEAIWSK